MGTINKIADDKILDASVGGKYTFGKVVNGSVHPPKVEYAEHNRRGLYVLDFFYDSTNQDKKTLDIKNIGRWNIIKDITIARNSKVNSIIFYNLGGKVKPDEDCLDCDTPIIKLALFDGQEEGDVVSSTITEINLKEDDRVIIEPSSDIGGAYFTDNVGYVGIQVVKGEKLLACFQIVVEVVDLSPTHTCNCIDEPCETEYPDPLCVPK